MKRILFVLSLFTFLHSSSGQDQDKYEIKLSTGNFNMPEKTLNDLLPPQDNGAYFGQKYFKIIQFTDIPNSSNRAQWEDQGLHLVDYIPQLAYFAVIDRSFDLSFLTSIKSVIDVDRRFKVEADMFFNGIPIHAQLKNDKVELVISYYETLDYEAVKTKLLPFAIIKDHRQYARQIDIIVDLDKVQEIIDLPFVQFIGPADPPPDLEIPYWRGSGRTNFVSTEFNGMNFTGQGVTIAVGEGGMIGVDDPDFKGRITEMNSGSTGGHKYGVSLRAAGAGNFNPRDKGIALGANFLSVGGGPNYENLYNSHDLRFTNHSLGYGISGSYSSSARSRDLFVQNNPAGMVQYSAGNSGGATGYAPYNTFSGWGNLTGTRKQFKNNLLAASCNAVDNVTGFSSRGPTYDGRIAPHLIIEGSGGTSHSAPKMIGNFAVLSQIYTSYNPGMEASSSLLKAVLMNTADDLDIPGIDFKTGYGRVNMRRAHDLISKGNIITSTIDNGISNSHMINVPAHTRELRVLVYWADEAAVVNAATALVNDIDLLIFDPSSSRHFPWVLDHTPNSSTLSNQATRQADHLNNVEQVTIENPSAGMYTIDINGFNIPSGPQEYHLVYEFLEEHIQITDPIKNEKIVPGEDIYIYWDAYSNSTASFNLEYQLGGGNWVLIDNAIDAAEREYKWTVPNLGQGIQSIKFRVTQGALSSVSEDNLIGELPTNVQVLGHCLDTLILSWDSVLGATSYGIYILDSLYMEEQVNNVVFDGNTVKIGGTSNMDKVYYAISAKTNGLEGRRTNAQNSTYQVEVPSSITFSNKNIFACVDEVVTYNVKFCTQNPMDIIASDGFVLSVDEFGVYTDSIQIQPMGIGLDQDIYVKLDSSFLNEGPYSGSILHATSGVSTFEMPIEAFEFISVSDRSTFAGEALESGEYLEVKDLNWSNPSSFTIEWWMMPYSYNNYNQQIGNGWGNFLFHASNSGAFSAGVANNSSRINSGSVLLEIDKWQHFAFVKDGNNFTLYKDGKIVGTSSSSSNVNWTNFLIGQSGGNSINGKIDEFRMWESARTLTDIRKNMHLTLDGDEEHLRVYLQFNAEQGSVVDFGPNCYEVTNSGFLRVPSQVSVAGGRSVSNTINYTGLSSFSDSDGDTGLDIDFIGGHPNGEVVVSHLRTEAPHGETPSSSLEVMNEYWIVNNFGSVNTGFEADMIFQMEEDLISPNIGDYKISKRANNELGSWDFTRDAFAVNQNNQSVLFNRIDDFSQFLISMKSEPDSMPGLALELKQSDEYALIPPLNLNTDSLTISCWIKPDGTQNDWSGIVFSRGGSTTAGLSVMSNNELRYHWNGGEWSYNTGAFVTPDEWNHVVLVISPSQMKLYVDGVEYIRNQTHAVEEFNGNTRIGNDAADQNRTFKGQIDEVCIWDRVLDIGEIRSSRHLTKEDLVLTDSHLKAYYQFNNQVDLAYDKTANGFHGSLEGLATKVDSDGPFGGGESSTLMINGAGVYSSAIGLDLEFVGPGLIPMGELVVSKINLLPNQLPSNKPGAQAYWIVNNYTSNQVFTGLDHIVISNSGLITPNTLPQDIDVYRRAENGFNAWQILNPSDSVNESLNQISFGQSASVDRFGQFFLVNQGAKGWVGVKNTDWHEVRNWGERVVPSDGDDVIIPYNTPYQPIVEANAAVSSLTLQSKAILEVLDNIMFTIIKP